MCVLTVVIILKGHMAGDRVRIGDTRSLHYITNSTNSSLPLS